MSEETRRHVNCLDGWRGMAIGLVLLGHFLLDDIAPRVGVLGVDIFFVLSGRLMAEILFVQKAPLPTFFLRRFSRIYPGLLFFVVVVSGLFALSPYGHGVVAAIAALTFSINYAMIFTHPVALLDHLWSLCVEEHAYVLLAAVALIMRAARWSALPVVLGLGLTAMASGVIRADVLHQDYFSVFWRTDVQVWSILIAAAVHLWIRNRPGLHHPWLAPVTLAAGIAAKLSGAGTLVEFGVGGLLLAISVSSLEHSLPAIRAVFENRALRQLGLWSYSIYLWQHPFYKLREDQAAPLALLLAAAFACAMFSFYLVEAPLRRELNQRGQLTVDRFFPARAA